MKKVYILLIIILFLLFGGLYAINNESFNINDTSTDHIDKDKNNDTNINDTSTDHIDKDNNNSDTHINVEKNLDVNKIISIELENISINPYKIINGIPAIYRPWDQPYTDDVDHSIFYYDDDIGLYTCRDTTFWGKPWEPDVFNPDLQENFTDKDLPEPPHVYGANNAYVPIDELSPEDKKLYDEGKFTYSKNDPRFVSIHRNITE